MSKHLKFILILAICAGSMIGCGDKQNNASSIPEALPEQSESSSAIPSSSEASSDETSSPADETPSEADSDEYAKIRAGIPYEGLTAYPINNYVLPVDDTAKKLADYLSMVNLPNFTIQSTADIKNSIIIYNALLVTPHYSTDSSDERYNPAVEVFVEPTLEVIGFPEDWFWIKEHVEQSIKLLYGDISFTHEDVSQFLYFEALGVYTPPHMGGGGTSLPVILSYEDSGDKITAEVAYVIEGMGGYISPDDGEDILEVELEDYVKNKSKKYIVTLEKISDDQFLFESQIEK